MDKQEIRNRCVDLLLQIHVTVDFEKWDPRRYWDAFAENTKGSAYISRDMGQFVTYLCKRMFSNPANHSYSAHMVSHVLSLPLEDQKAMLRLLREEAIVIVAMVRAKKQKEDRALEDLPL